MEWLTAIFSGPYSEARIGALLVPFVLAIFYAINASKKEQERKGWHPVTKAAAFGFAAVALVTLGAAFI